MELEPWEYEALSWLRKNKNKSALATNCFETTSEAIEAVKKLYAAGATLVKLGPVLDEPERIQEEGGAYADSITVSFPKDKTDDVLAIVRELRPDMGGRRKDIFLDDQTHSPSLMLWWD
jgi:hypothetical protein